MKELVKNIVMYTYYHNFLQTSSSENYCFWLDVTPRILSIFKSKLLFFFNVATYYIFSCMYIVTCTDTAFYSLERKHGTFTSCFQQKGKGSKNKRLKKKRTDCNLFLLWNPVPAWNHLMFQPLLDMTFAVDGAARGWMHPTVHHPTFLFTFKSGAIWETPIITTAITERKTHGKREENRRGEGEEHANAAQRGSIQARMFLLCG